ncbi:HNH endonuclease [Angustibacter sp. McL0619]|uniref:HNH endonuclease n=1 Tax=Angustibacter sp. McL0619 TaxID=3415676 RepID=UPI003CEE12F8
MTTRGTSNTNVRGSSTDRQRRREWLVETWRADVDVTTYIDMVEHRLVVATVDLGEGEPACRCYRCGRLLTVSTVTADRRVPGCQGGTYRRENLRPACGGCNSATGGQLGVTQKAAAARAAS